MPSKRAPSLAAVERRVLEERLRPPPRLTVSQWADRYRVLSPEGSFRAGPFNSDDAPYQREFMDICGDPRYPSVVGMWASQSGKTETLNCVAGYYIDQDPSPILMLQPTEKMAEAWSKDRLAPMLRDTPRLKGKVSDARSRDSGNTILHKQFAGGHLTVAGSNSPASLASRPIRILLLDEIDRYPPSAGAEGDPAAIAESRTSTFPNRKIIRVSSPTLKGSPIEQAWESSDQRWFYVPCPHCRHEQKLEFGGAKTNFGLKWDAGQHETAHYVCAACAAFIEESDKLLMLKNGRWIPDNPSSRIPGFRLSALYSPFFPWSRLIERWLRDKGDPLKLRTFVNTMLCEPWEETGEGVTAHILQDRMEPFPEKDGEKLVPAKAAVLTRSVDVQGDRLETCVYAWADGEETWRVDFELIPGDPATAAPWDELGRLIAKPYRHELGSVMRCAATFIDSGGHHAKEAYEFARGRVRQRVFAIKGSSLQQGVPLLSKPVRNPSAKVIMYSVGSFTGKEALMSRLAKVTEPGPGYIHLPDDIDPQHLDQFLNERIVTRFVKGRPVRAWVRSGPNEQIDLWVYALAALHSLGPNVFRRLGIIVRTLEAQAKARSEAAEATPLVPQAAGEQVEEEPAARRPKKKRRSRWVDGWKD
jgi:phage terminase large subunit GpA-like protein